MTLKTRLLCFVMFLLPWQTRWIFGQATIAGAETPFGVLSLHATEALVLLVALVCFVRKDERPQIDRAYRVPLALAVCIFAVVALTLVWTEHISVALNQLFHLGTALVVFMLLLDKKLALRPLLASFGAGLVVPFSLGVWQIVFDASPASTVLGLATRDAAALGDSVTLAADGTRQLRAYGSFPHPNIFAGYLAVGVLSLRALWRRGMRGWQGCVLQAGMLALIVGVVLTASRSALLGLALGVGLALLVTHMKNTKLARIAVIPVAILVIGSALFASVVLPAQTAALRGGGYTEERSVVERVVQYANYPKVVGGEWLLGSGLGTYAFAAADAEPGLMVWAYQPIHNVPLLIVAEIGIIGALVVLAWSSSIDRVNFARFPNADAVVAFAMGNVVLVILFFDHYIWSTWAGLALLAYVMALTVRMGEEEKQ